MSLPQAFAQSLVIILDKDIRDVASDTCKWAMIGPTNPKLEDAFVLRSPNDVNLQRFHLTAAYLVPSISPYIMAGVSCPS